MILPPTASQQAISAAIALAEGTGLALVLLMIAFFVKKLRLGKLWNAALQLFFCCARYCGHGAFCKNTQESKTLLAPFPATE